MKLRKISHTGIEVSEIGVGVWSLVTEEWGANINKAEEILRKAYEMGINFFDTADVYGNGLGEKVLAKVFSTKRDKIIILTKIGLDFYNGKVRGNYDVNYLEFAFKKSLERLNTDYVDVLMLHNPKMSNIKDRKILDFFIQLKKEGKVKIIGVALGPTLGWGEEGTEAIKQGYESLEYIYNLIELKPGIDFLKYDIGHFIRVPHASDVLNEFKWPINYDPKLHRHFKDINWINKAIERTKPLLQFAKDRNMSLSQLALKFVLYNPKVTSVLPNITSLEELKHFVEIEEKPDLTEEEFNYLLRFSLDKFKDLNEESIQETLRYK